LTFADQRRRDRLRKLVAVELGKLVARLHGAGIRHDDLHAANILIRMREDRPELFLIDLNAVKVGSALGWRDRRTNLVLLNRWFVRRWSRADRLRFWRAYYEASGLGAWHRGPGGSRRHFDLAREVHDFPWTSSRAFWGNRDRRCLRSNRYYRK